jgi:methyl-accepting chemotaxis protein
MLGRINSKSSNREAELVAIDKSQARIEFAMDGTIVTANENFLKVMGYSLAEIQGKHHSLFVEPSCRTSAEYRNLWAALGRGETQQAEFKRLAKGGREVWILGSYNPILDRNGKPFKVVKFATDVTAERLQSVDFAGQLQAIGKSQAVIEFAMDGTIQRANENFLTAMGYRLDEVQGKHHSLFVAPAERDSAAYRELWAALNRGEYKAAEFKRVGKGDKEVWIQASYNPILDMTGKPFKVVKFATDVTRQKLQNADFAGQIEAIGKSQAVIEFALDGTIKTANDAFLATMGYTLAEIEGRHHSLFVPAAERDGAAYREFWAALNRGEYQSAEFKRLAKGGKEVWIQASYNPILDMNGKPFKVVKFASDVTAQVLRRLKSEAVSSTMEMVAAGAEQLSASVREISESMAKSKSAADDAFERSIAVDHTTERLADVAQSMNGILALIGDITSQINLLALNATIEAARAGEAGRGFAVVATEVKNLAAQAKSATDEIAQEIEGMKTVSTDVIGGLKSIRQSIDRVREHVTSTASAVEEQSTVTHDMSASMQRAAAEASSLG